MRDRGRRASNDLIDDLVPESAEQKLNNFSETSNVLCSTDAPNANKQSSKRENSIWPPT